MEITTNQFSALLTPLQDSRALLKDSDKGRAKLKQMLLTCCVVYPAFGKDADVVGLMYLAYVEFLGEYESGKVHEAFLKHIQNEVRFPTIADIRKEVTKGSMSGMFG